MTPVEADLMPGETLLVSWKISARSFLVRAGVIVSVWVVIGQAASLGQSLQTTLLALPGAVIVGLFYMWVFGELDIWGQNRRTDWHLTDRAIHIVPGDDLPSRLALTDIRRINRWPWWSLVIRFNSGTATTIPIPPKPAALRARILDARVRALPEGAQ
ncbi:hypothetical protein [uncultured Tateyamaria sp.]|uniref:hypothetical protein n=1 Tax=uncultured Tateyamaria sp. TaxID=455651 RepID=UPI00262897EF|nr:hypothetical protein [uncultured Tateyamaria sp.]